jgi:ankyrin repeat protein
VACARGWTEGVKILIDYKSDLNCRDKRGNTALHWSVQRHYSLIALILIQAECNMDLLDTVFIIL